jgi:nicotinamide-nucleotide amidase
VTEHDTADADRASELAHAVARSLDGRTVATAESCTAGRVMAAFATVAHAAEFFRGGLVAYQESVKRDVLGVEAVSVYSLRAVEQMARGVAALVGADAAVATSGVVGDAPVDGTDPGTIYVGTLVDGDVRSVQRLVAGDPAAMCADAVCVALDTLRSHLRARVGSPG